MKVCDEVALTLRLSLYHKLLIFHLQNLLILVKMSVPCPLCTGVFLIEGQVKRHEDIFRQSKDQGPIHPF